MRLLRCSPPLTVIWRPLADTIPLVTLFEYVPSGLPIATGCWAPTVVVAPLVVCAGWRSSAPVALSARYVPPEAIVAARTEASSTGPTTPGPRDELRDAGGTGATGELHAGVAGCGSFQDV